MVLDMANSDASSAKVRVLVSFYLVATDDTNSSNARTSAIHKEKLNVPLGGDEHNDRSNFACIVKKIERLSVRRDLV